MYKKPIGVKFNNIGEAEILVWAPLAKQVDLVIINEHSVIPLKAVSEGYWKLTTSQLKAGDLYKIQLNGDQQLPDPASRSQPEGVHGPSQAIDISKFNWTDQNWKNPELREYLLYELHTGTFSPKASFAGISEKTDYLTALGINAIEIMPVSQFPGARNWGYDGVFPFATQHSYGGFHGLQELVNTCHSKNIAVVLDVVYNHLGPEGNHFPHFGPYFTEKYSVPWGEAVNLDDKWCDGARNLIIENALMWFRDFHIDALRIDAVHALKDFSAKNILQELKEATEVLTAATGRNYHLIVECDLNDVRYINPIEKGGYGMDAQWIDEFHHALRIAAGGEQNGYYADFNGVLHLAKAYKDAYVYDGIYSPHRKRIFGSSAKKNPGEQFVVFSQNHDQIGNRMLGERPSTLFSLEMQKLMAGAVMVSPFIPMLFMGEEYGETNPFLYFVSHTDQKLRKIVNEGRRKEFEAFHTADDFPDPSDADTFNKSRLQWNLLNKQPHHTLFLFYKNIIALRKKTNLLNNMNRKNLSVSCNEQNKTINLERWDDKERLLCIMNFSDQKQEMQIPNTYKKILLNSASPLWRGPGEITDTFIYPASFVIYV